MPWFRLFLLLMLTAAPPAASIADVGAGNETPEEWRGSPEPGHIGHQPVTPADVFGNSKSSDPISPPSGGPQGWERFRPAVTSRVDWELPRDGFGVVEAEFAARFGTYPVFGPPPPFITPSLTLTLFEAPFGWQIPSELYAVGVEFSWLRPINDRWAVRFGVTPTLASDLENTSSQAWRFRGMALAFYDWTPEWKLGFGVVLTGREDLALMPGIGAVWSPTERTKVDFMFPRPRAAYRLLTNDRRQTWTFFSGGFGGGTWAIQRPDGSDDLLTYRSWQLTAGIEWTPGGSPAAPWARSGLRGSIEAGYLFGRRMEFENSSVEFHPGSTGLLSAGFSY